MASFDLSLLSDALLAHKKPFTLQQARAIRDIAIAIAEGAPGATRVAARMAAGAAPFTATDVDDYGGLVADIAFYNSTGTDQQLLVAVSDDTTTFGATTLIGLVPGSASGMARVFLDFASGQMIGVVHRTGGHSLVNVAVTGLTSDARSIRFTVSGAMTASALVHLNGGAAAS